MIDTAVSFGNGLFVVVDNDDEIAAKFRPCHVECFHSLAARERAVANDRHNVLFAAQDVATFGKSKGESHRRRSMSDVEEIVFAFFRI